MTPSQALEYSDRQERSVIRFLLKGNRTQHVPVRSKDSRKSRRGTEAILTRGDMIHTERSFPPSVALIVTATLAMLLLASAQDTVHTRAGLGGTVLPRGEWIWKAPGEAGFDKQRLDSFASLIGGAGCVVRHGNMVYAWGNYTDRAEIGSAFKPIYAQLVYKAIEKGLIADLDSPVSRYVPELRNLNSSLGHKDRLVTWRHLLTQTSCYGVSEKPGTAFDYSDYQTALLVDTLVHKVYGSNFSRADKEVLLPHITGPIGCQDNPTISGNWKTLDGRLRISARDFARFGFLYLAGGKFGEDQVLDPVIVDMALSTPLPTSFPRTRQTAAEMLPDQRSIGGGKSMEDHMGCYSYFWWLNRKTADGSPFFPDAPSDTFAALGHGGRHALIVVPSLDMVVCWVDGLKNEQPRNISFSGRQAVNEVLKLLGAALRKSS
ncbi:beta-lactamase family protein [bacterium]|nr:beta-lactamase family protein [bacterium]